MRLPALLLVVAAIGCKSKHDRKADEMPEPTATKDAAVAVHVDAPEPWPELDGYPGVTPERIVALPAKPDLPRFEVGGPAIAGDVAVVASSQFGFVAVDWRKGAIAWSKPAGSHVAPPLYLKEGALPAPPVGGAPAPRIEGSVVLIGDCVAPPKIPDGEYLVGCVRVVTPTGTDEAYSAIRAKPKAIEKFADARGAQAVWRDGEHSVRWRRGEAAITIDLVNGAARPADPTPPPLVVDYKTRRWEITQVDGRIVAHERGKEAWATKHPYTAMLGPVWLPEQSPMLRIANLGTFRGVPEVHILDIDATGSLRGQASAEAARASRSDGPDPRPNARAVYEHPDDATQRDRSSGHASRRQAARPAPGIGLLGWGMSSIGDVAIAVRLDSSLRRDVVVGYAANALLMWAYALPYVPRPDPVGIAIADDAVVVFHDGDTLTILPELSAPPTTPGAARASSKIPTP